MRMRDVVICGLSGCTTFSPNYVVNGTIFGGGGVIEHKKCVLIPLYILPPNICHSTKEMSEIC